MKGLRSPKPSPSIARLLEAEPLRAVCRALTAAWRHTSGTQLHAAAAPLGVRSFHLSPMLRDAAGALEQQQSLATKPYKLLSDGQESVVARPKVLRLPSRYAAYKDPLVTVDELTGEPYGVCCRPSAQHRPYPPSDAPAWVQTLYEPKPPC